MMIINVIKKQSLHSRELTAFSQEDKKIKITEILNGSMAFNISYLNSLNNADCVPFSCMDSFHIVHNLAN